MSDEHDMDDGPEEATIGRLLRLAGERRRIPPGAEARIYRRVEEEWRRATSTPAGERVYRAVHEAWRRNHGRPFRRFALPVALAASALLAVIIVLRPAPLSAPGSADHVIGSVARVVVSEQTGLPRPGSRIVRGQRVATAAGEGISVRITGSESLRLDENTTVIFDGRHELTLMAGRIYADTGDLVYRDRNLVVTTPAGRITDIGTRFVVALEDALLEVAVRDGRVDVVRGATEHMAVGGERMTLAADGDVEIEHIEPHDDYWHWAASLAPVYDIDGKSLFDFLRWAARETGHELVFGDEELRLAAMRTDLHGSIRGFTPIEAVESVLATTAFTYRIESGRILVER